MCVRLESLRLTVWIVAQNAHRIAAEVRFMDLAWFRMAVQVGHHPQEVPSGPASWLLGSSGRDLNTLRGSPTGVMKASKDWSAFNSAGGRPDVRGTFGGAVPQPLVRPELVEVHPVLLKKTE